MLTGCAVRVVETSGGRVSAVITEKGRIGCGSVVLAGGAWSRLFCGNLDIQLPQLKVLASVMRTEPLEGGPEISASGGIANDRLLDEHSSANAARASSPFGMLSWLTRF